MVEQPISRYCPLTMHTFALHLLYITILYLKITSQTLVFNFHKLQIFQIVPLPARRKIAGNLFGYVFRYEKIIIHSVYQDLNTYRILLLAKV
jgi:hypothetical protein